MSEVQVQAEAAPLPVVSAGRYKLSGEGRNFVLSYVEDTCESCRGCGCGTPQYFTTADALKLVMRNPLKGLGGLFGGGSDGT